LRESYIMKFWSWYTLYMTYTLIEYVEDV